MNALVTAIPTGITAFSATNLDDLVKFVHVLTRYGNNLVPFVLIGLGVLIVVESRTLSSRTLTILTLVASYLCLMTLDRNNRRSPSA